MSDENVALDLMIDLMADLERMEGELRDMRGRIEVISNQIFRKDT